MLFRTFNGTLKSTELQGHSRSHLSASDMSQMRIHQRVSSFGNRTNNKPTTQQEAEEEQSMKQLLVNPQEDGAIVDQMLEGLVASHRQLVLVKKERLVLHRDYATIRERQVTVLSGGGSGHEPAHAGYIGHGMLTGAICGDVFASPSTHQVLTAIRLAAGPHGCLLVVKNYTGDRINFGLAVEHARAEGLKVDMVFIGEDAAVDTNAGRRGLCGTVVIHKLAGAAAKEGKDLASIVEMLNSVVNDKRLATIGVSFDPCTLPGQKAASESGRHVLSSNEMEIGMGIHGEPGVSKCAMMQVKPLVHKMTELLMKKLVGTDCTRKDLLLMVNNLGAMTTMELYVIAKHTIDALRSVGLRVDRVMVGSMMTALDMKGFSLTVWQPASDDQLTLFDSPTSAIAWSYRPYPQYHEQGCFLEEIPVKSASAKPTSRPNELNEDGKVVEKCTMAACTSIVDKEPELTRWDSQVGDGDCGTTLKGAAEAILADMKASYPLNDPAACLCAIAGSIRKTAGGTSGVLYDIFFTAGANELSRILAQDGHLSVSAWHKCFEAGVLAIQKYGGAKEGSRTMLDALIPASRAVAQMLVKNPNASANQVLDVAAVAAQTGADNTKNISTKHAFGRSAYVGDAFSQGVPDPGAQAVACWIKAIRTALAN